MICNQSGYRELPLQMMDLVIHQILVKGGLAVRFTRSRRQVMTDLQYCLFLKQPGQILQPEEPRHLFRRLFCIKQRQ